MIYCTIYVQFGSPIMLSWPHFFQADPALLQAVDGLNPEQQKHQFAIDLVPVSILYAQKVLSDTLLNGCSMSMGEVAQTSMDED